MRELIPTEEQEQEALCDWLRLNGIVFHHSPNEGKHAVQYRVKQARLGVSKGFPDIVIFDCTIDGFRGIAVELKRRKGGRVSDEQKWWMQRLEDREWAVRVCYGADEAIEWLVSLGVGRGAA